MNRSLDFFRGGATNFKYNFNNKRHRGSHFWELLKKKNDRDDIHYKLGGQVVADLGLISTDKVG